MHSVSPIQAEGEAAARQGETGETDPTAPHPHPPSHATHPRAHTRTPKIIKDHFTLPTTHHPHTAPLFTHWQPRIASKPRNNSPPSPLTGSPASRSRCTISLSSARTWSRMYTTCRGGWHKRDSRVGAVEGGWLGALPEVGPGGHCGWAAAPVLALWSFGQGRCFGLRCRRQRGGAGACGWLL